MTPSSPNDAAREADADCTMRHAWIKHSYAMPENTVAEREAFYAGYRTSRTEADKLRVDMEKERRAHASARSFRDSFQAQLVSITAERDIARKESAELAQLLEQSKAYQAVIVDERDIARRELTELAQEFNKLASGEMYRDAMKALDERIAERDQALTVLRLAWEKGITIARGYGDNIIHLQGEQKERQWAKTLAELTARHERP